MKPILLIICFLFAIVANAQYTYIHYETVTFDKTNPSLLDSLNLDTTRHNNTWQIGKPGKLILDSAYLSNKAIITDTINNCGPNDTSIFTVSFRRFALGMILYGLSFRYKSDIDTDCIMKIEAQHTNMSWLNLTDTPYVYQQFDTFAIPNSKYPPIDTPNFLTSANIWKLVTLNINASGVNVNGNFRFTFITGNNSQNKEGWMIDELRGIYLAYSGIEITHSSKYCLYPNPSKGQFTITAKSAETVDVRVTDVLGRSIYTTLLHPQNGSINNTIDLRDVASGLYYVRLKTKDEMETIKLVVEH